MKTKHALVLCGIGAALLVLLAVVTARPSLPEGGVTIVFTAGLQGELRPCGCDPAERGGQARRLAVIRRLRRELGAVLVVDGGDFLGLPAMRGFDKPRDADYLSPNKARFARLKMDALLEGFEACPIDAVGLGERDFLLGQAYLRGWERRLPLTSANVVYATSDRPVFPAYVTRTVGQGRVLGIPYGGVKVGIFSLLWPQARLDYRGDPNPLRALALVPTAEAVVKTLRQEEACDLVVCLFHGQERQALRFSRQVEGVDVCLVGHGFERIMQAPDSRTGVVVAGVPDKGKYVGRLFCKLSEGGRVAEATLETIPLMPDLPGAPEGEAIYRAYLDRLRVAALTPDTLLPDRGVYGGGESCGRCHARQAEQWRSTPHGHAMDTLRKVGQDANPECLQCHTTGYGEPSGFFSEATTPGLIDVGCEVCHGPRDDHVKEHEKALDAGTLTLPLRDVRWVLSPIRCKDCHTPTRDPRFSDNKMRRFAAIKHRPTGK